MSVKITSTGGISALGGLSSTQVNNYFACKVGIGTNRPDYALTIDNGDLLVCMDNGGYFQADESADAIKHSDNVKAMFGTGNDLQIYHNSSNNISFIENSNANGLRIKSDELLFFANNGSTLRADFGTAVKLLYNDAYKFETTSDGIKATGAICGTGNLNIDGNSTLMGNLSVRGSVTCIDTRIETTSAIEVQNAGTGPAILANQLGSQPVVDFQDDGTSAFYIEDGGNVGIGCTNPTEKLEVAGNIIAKDGGFLAGVGGDKDGFVFHDLYTAGGNYYGLKAFSGPTRLSIVTDGAEYLTTNANGCVGIKTTAPGQRLTVAGNISACGGLSAHSHTNKANYFSGKVGIGTNRPLGTAHIYTADAGAAICTNSNHDDLIIENNTNAGIQIAGPTSSYQYLAFGDTGSANQGYVRYYHDADRMDLRAGGSDILSLVDASAGIGTTTPNEKFTVAGRISALGHICTCTGNVYAACGRFSNDVCIGGNELFFANDAASAYIRAADTLFIESDYDADDTDKHIIFQTGAKQRARITTHGLSSSGGLSAAGSYGAVNYFAGNVGIGTNRPDGALNLADGCQMRLGSGGNFRFYHSTNNCIEGHGGDILVYNYAHGKDIIFCAENSSGTAGNYIHIDSSANCTIFGKNTRHSDNVSAYFGCGGDLQIFHDTADSVIKENTRHLCIQNVASNGDICLQNTNGGNVKVVPDSTMTVSGNISACGGLSATEMNSYFACNVGIGTNKPEYPLHVGGSISLSLASEPSIYQGALMPVDRGASQVDYKFRTRNAAGSYADVWYVDTSSSNFGIGTCEPAERLTVAGNISASGDVCIGDDLVVNGESITICGAAALLQFCDTTDTDDMYMTFSHGGATYGSVGYIGTTDFDICTSNRDISLLPGTANVGIGETAPGEKLTVCGSLSSHSKCGGYCSDNKTFNTKIGSDALLDITSGSKNTALGYQASTNATIGTQNVTIGYNAALAHTEGEYNVVIGSQAHMCNTTCDNNTAVGYLAGLKNTANSNSFFGAYAAACNTSGVYNTAIGYASQNYGTTGGGNTSLGYTALYINNAGGAHNTALGSFAMLCNTSGSCNVAVGTCSLCSNTTSCDNIAVGFRANCSTTTGSRNVGVGSQPLICNIDGAKNVAVGYQSMYYNISGSNNVAIGCRALMMASSNVRDIAGSCNNIGIGEEAAQYVSTGQHNIGIGYQANMGAAAGICGNQNIGIGCIANKCITTGAANIAMGNNAGAGTSTGNFSVSIGACAGSGPMTVGCNISIGLCSGQGYTSGCNNVGLGLQTLNCNTTGNYNFAVGMETLKANTCGQSNIGIGFRVLQKQYRR